MANLYVYNVGGDNANSGASWALPKADLAGAAAIDVAGDTIHVDYRHNESNAANVSWTFAGTANNVTRVLSVDQGLTGVYPGAYVQVTGNLTIIGGIYMRGFHFQITGGFTLGSNNAVIQHYRDCNFYTTNVGSAGATSQATGTSAMSLVLENCEFKFGAATQYVQFGHRGQVIGGRLAAGTVTPNNVFAFGSAGRGGDLNIDGFDCSAAGPALNLIGGTATASSTARLRNIKLPANWTGRLVNSADGTFTAPGARAEMYDSSSGDVHIRIRVSDYCGYIYDTELYTRSDVDYGTEVPYAIAMATNQNPFYPSMPLQSPDLTVVGLPAGSPVTLTVETLYGGADYLKDDEIWLEVQELGNTDSRLAVFKHDSKDGYFAVAQEQTVSTAGWNTGAMGAPKKQKLSVTFTPQKAGAAICRVMLAKRGVVVNIDPEVRVS